MFDHSRLEIPEMRELRESLSDAAARQTAGRERHRFVRGAIAFAAAAVLLGAVVLIADPFDTKPGLDQALAEIAAKIELAPDAPPGKFTYSRSTLEHLEVIPDGVDRLGRRFEGGFPVWKKTLGEAWTSRTKQGATYFRGTTATFADHDRATGERIIAASKQADAMAKTPEGRRELRKLQAPYFDPTVKDPTFGAEPFFFTDIQTQAVEHGKINPDGDFHVGPMTLTEKQVQEFPRDPRLAHEWVLSEMQEEAATAKKASEQSGAEQFVQPADELTWQVLTSGAGFFNDALPADLRATFVRALKFVPGVTVVGEVKDSKGRDGIAFEKEFQGVTSRVTFDSDSAVLIEQVSTLTDPTKASPPDWDELRQGTTIERLVLEEIRTVDQVPPSER